MNLKIARLTTSIFLIFSFFCSSLSAELPSRTDSENYLPLIDEIIKSCSKEIEKELKLVCVGSGGRMPRDIEEVKLVFHAYRKAGIEQARELEVKATAMLLEAINSHEKIRPYLREYPFKANRTEISISFCKLDNSRYTDGSVCLVFAAKGNLHYHSKEPGAELFTDLLSEPYEEAVKLVQNPLLKKPSLVNDKSVVKKLPSTPNAQASSSASTENPKTSDLCKEYITVDITSDQALADQLKMLSEKYGFYDGKDP